MTFVKYISIYLFRIYCSLNRLFNELTLFVYPNLSLGMMYRNQTKTIK